MAQELSHGNRELWWAPIDAGSIGAPVRWHGLGSTEQESEQESEAIYKDDIVYYMLEGKPVYKLTINVAQIPADFAQACLGYKETAEGAWAVSGSPKPCVLCYRTTVMDGVTGVERPKLHYFYNAMPSAPKLETETDEDKPTENEIEIEFTCSASSIVTDSDGIPTPYAVIERLSQNQAFFDTYTSKVLQPTKAVRTVTFNADGDIVMPKERGGSDNA